MSWRDKIVSTTTAGTPDQDIPVKKSSWRDKIVSTTTAGTPDQDIPVKKSSWRDKIVSTETEGPSFAQELVERGPSAAIRDYSARNPKEAAKYIPAVAALASAPFTAGMSWPAAAAVSGAVGVGSDVAKQAAEKYLGVPPPPGGMPGRAKEATISGVTQAAAEVGGRGLVAGAGKAMRWLGQKGGQLLGRVSTARSGVGDVVMENPEITKSGFYTPQRIENFVNEATQKIKEAKEAAAQVINGASQASVDAGKVADAAPVHAAAQELADNIGVGQEGVKEFAAPETAKPRQILADFSKEHYTQGDPEMADFLKKNPGIKIPGASADPVPKPTMTAEALLRLRRAVDGAINYSREIASPVEAHLSKFRAAIDSAIEKHFPAIKAGDLAYQNATAAEEALKSYGIKPGMKYSQYSPDELSALEAKIGSALKKGAPAGEALAKNDVKMGTNFQKTAKQLAATAPSAPGEDPVFDQIINPRAKTALGGAAMTGTAFWLVRAANHLGYALIPIGAMVGTSPVAAGAMFRGVPVVAKAAEAAAPAIPGVIRALLAKRGNQ